MVELLLRQGVAPGRYVDAATLACTLGVERDWVYARAAQLGAVRLGDGPRARLRFDLEQVRATLADAGSAAEAERVPPAHVRPARPRSASGPTNVPLIRGRSGR
ncbi:hypothetical protein [Solirubrobacter deserti]|uniref:hypothetical protein n=1 Tax=Solirubrobacter deserti TaxID=2282478 RepID=UPI0022CD4435|nr:hypothetical protein [Solirubrobacter deserti]